MFIVPPGIFIFSRIDFTGLFLLWSRSRTVRSTPFLGSLNLPGREIGVDLTYSCPDLQAHANAIAGDACGVDCVTCMFNVCGLRRSVHVRVAPFCSRVDCATFGRVRRGPKWGSVCRVTVGVRFAPLRARGRKGFPFCGAVFGPNVLIHS